MQSHMIVNESVCEDLLRRLKKSQSIHGYLPQESMVEIAEALKIPVGRVFGVATFYSLISTKPLGRNVIRVCKSVPCYLNGVGMIIDRIKEEIGIQPGETTPDMRFSFLHTNCIGACDISPAMLVNDDVHGHLNPKKISQILRSYE